MNYIQYILTASACLSIFYIAYRLMFRNEVNFNQLRFYLLASIAVSVTLPLTGVSLNMDFVVNLFIEPKVIIPFPMQETTLANSPAINIPVQQSINWGQAAKGIYFMVAAMLLIRIVLQIFTMVIRYFSSERVRLGRYTLISNNQKNAFSFFRWIFINRELTSSEEFDQIVSHERVHASQYHSIDLILIELLAAVMWFNPLIWMMRNSIQLVHEYLADEGALSTGIDRLRYQALLVNQAAEERLICLSSSFNHSLIKKRMIMMTKSKFNHGTKLGVLAIVPVSVVVLIFTAGINGLFANNTKAESATVITKLQKTEINTAADTVGAKKVIVKKGQNATTYTVKVESDEDGKSEMIWVSSDDTADSAYSKSTVHVFNVTDDKLIVIHKSTDNPQKDTVIVMDKNGKVPSDVIYIVDGVEQPDKSAVDKIDAKTIRTMEIYKGDQVKKYTTKDCDGVILISTKKDVDSSNVLYIVDGVEQPNGMKDINPENIKEVNIIKGDDMKKYTTKDYDGVILITTKKGKK